MPMYGTPRAALLVCYCPLSRLAVPYLRCTIISIDVVHAVDLPAFCLITVTPSPVGTDVAVSLDATDSLLSLPYPYFFSRRVPAHFLTLPGLPSLRHSFTALILSSLYSSFLFQSRKDL